MFSGLGKFWRDLMTEDDNNSVYCPIRVFGAGLMSTHVGATLWATAIHGVFDPVAFGTGSAALIAAVGGAIGVKAKLGA